MCFNSATAFFSSTTACFNSRTASFSCTTASFSGTTAFLAVMQRVLVVLQSFRCHKIYPILRTVVNQPWLLLNGEKRLFNCRRWPSLSSMDITIYDGNLNGDVLQNKIIVDAKQRERIVSSPYE